MLNLTNISSHSFLFLLFLLLILLLLPPPPVYCLTFTDVTQSSGLSQPNGKSLKYGGAVVADVNGDGWEDLLLLHHNSAPAELYLNGRGGLNFKRAPWKQGGDIHGATAFRYSPRRRGLSFLIQRGGGWGKDLQAPYLFNVHARTNEISVANPAIPARAGARGRSACAISLRAASVAGNSSGSDKSGITIKDESPRPDIILTSAYLLNNAAHQRALELHPSGLISVRHTHGSFASERNEFINVVDIDDDGRLEIVTFQALHIYAINDAIGDFALRDVTDIVLPQKRQYEDRYPKGGRSHIFKWLGVVATVELDYDNDGRWDMFLARTTQQNLHWLPPEIITDDVLLRNVGGRFDDVSMSAGITPFLNGYSRGVTAGDFDNDGWVDLIVARYKGPDVFLRNRGGGMFDRPVDAGFRRPWGTPGDMVTAVDLDQDGRLDVVVSEGSWYQKSVPDTWGKEKGPGRYRIMRNTARNIGNYVLVRVRNSPTRRATGLHAVVTLSFQGERRLIMKRRVGNPGTAASVSFVETVHFGVGKRTNIWRLLVRWSNGETQTLWNVAVNRKYVVGHG